jgi:hypothetical protein
MRARSDFGRSSAFNLIGQVAHFGSSNISAMSLSFIWSSDGY